MKNKYTIQQSSETTWWYTFLEQNAKGERLVIEVNKNIDCGFKNSIPKLWYKNGWTNKVLEEYWSIRTYVKDTEGASYMLYNPQLKRMYEINFDWILEAAEENLNKLIDEVWILFSTAQGETATEEKYRKVKEHAKKNNIELITELPNGWKVIERAMTAPCGSVWVGNMKSIISGKRKTALLIESR